MSREALAAWGRDLPEDEFARALAGLGVVLASYGSYFPDSPATPGSYEEVLDRATSSGEPLEWDLGRLANIPGEHRTAALGTIDATEVAAAWSSSVSGRTGIILSLRFARILSPVWLLHTLLPGALGVEDVCPVLDRPRGRLRWGWPLRIGFLAEPSSRELRDSLYEDLPDHLAALTDPEIGPSRCDLLLLPLGPHRALAALDESSPLPQSTCVVLLGKGGSLARDLDRFESIASRLSAWGVAAAPIGQESIPDWFGALLTELSHDEPLDRALRRANQAGQIDRAILFAAADLFRLARLSEAVGAMTGRMLATANGGTVDLPVDTADELGLGPPRTRGLGPIDRGEPRATRSIGADEVAARVRETGLAFDHERAGATHTARISRAARPVVEAAERNQASARFIRAAIRDPLGKNGARLERAFRAGRQHEIWVSIGPKDQEWMVAAEAPFPENLLEPDPNGHRLTVVFTEPVLLDRPLVESVELPPVGASGTARFHLDIGNGTTSVEARISVLHRGRILQTAVLRGPVRSEPDLEPGTDERIEVLIEAVLRPGMADLDDRQRFDAAIVLNHARGGGAAATVLAGRDAAYLSIDWAKKEIEDLEAVFYDAERDKAFNRKLGSAESVKYLRRLARKGTLLYDSIGKLIEEAHGPAVSYVQVLSANPNTFLPIELVYDLPTPSQDAKLCGNAVKALKTGRCNEKSHKVNEEGHLRVVCPSGFWGVTKVIERHAVNPSRLAQDPETRGVDFLAVSEPIGDRKTLGAITPILFAASDRVNNVEPDALARVTASLRALSNGALVETDTWQDWVKQVKREEPAVLLLLSHTVTDDPEGAALEINKESAKQRRYLDEINERHVNTNAKRAGPIVLLLGCDTAVPQVAFQSFLVQFKEKGSSLVVGTIAPILGRHAGRAAEAFVEQLREISETTDGPDRGVPFGEVMRTIRRNLLAKGILMALCLTSYGDVDWRFAIKG